MYFYNNNNFQIFQMSLEYVFLLRSYTLHTQNGSLNGFLVIDKRQELKYIISFTLTPSNKIIDENKLDKLLVNLSFDEIRHFNSQFYNFI